jgi:hypothetical protein
MLDYHPQYKLKGAVLAYVCSQLITKAEREKFDSIFHVIDENGDG